MSEETKHTPGPWELVDRTVESDGSVFPMHITGGSRGLVICSMELAPRSAYRDEMMEGNGVVCSRIANARLISAAPDLLAALKECQEFLSRLTRPTDSDINTSSAIHWAQAAQIELRAREALAKAQGGAK